MRLAQKFTITDDNYGSFFLRLSFAIMIIPHGLEKLFGTFGGIGYEKAIHIFTTLFGIPWILALLVFLIELFSGIALIIGFQTRINALLLAIVMAVAGSFHFKYGFHMNWFGDKAGEGFEFHILAVGMMLALALIGGGKYSLDRKMMKDIR